MRLIPCLLLALALAAPAAAQTAPDVRGVALGAHPSEDYQAALATFQGGDRLLGGCLFYRAQFRYRTYLGAREGQLDPSGDPALAASLFETVGRPINEWLGGDVDDWLAAIDCAAAWAEAEDDPLTPKAQFQAVHDEVLSGLLDLRATIEAEREQIPLDRAANGLANR